MASRLRKPEAGSIGVEIDSAAAAFRAAGIADAELLAVNTWAALADTAPGAVWLARNDPPPASVLPGFRDAIARQLAGVPAQYAVGRAGFRHLDLYVDRRVLIPRSETEGLVEHVLDHAKRVGRWGIAADIGTGSGAIALSLATEGSFERIIATDQSAEALEVARINHAGVAPRTPVEFRQGSLLEPIRETANVIVSNPPYVSTGEWSGLPAGVRDHEPRLALDGGPDGLDPTRVLLERAGAHLLPGGLIALEIDSIRGARTLELARACGWSNGRVLHDATGRDRFFLATRELE